MKPDRSDRSFRPATVKDLSRLRRWLNSPEVLRWWDDPSEQFELLKGDLNEPLMTMRIVHSADGLFDLEAKVVTAAGPAVLMVFEPHRVKTGLPSSTS
jgi:hypothetical protein